MRYVSGDVHTQTIDDFWSLVKRGISGTYHSVSPEYLHSYVNELTWRYDRRTDPMPMFFSMVQRAALD